MRFGSVRLCNLRSAMLERSLFLARADVLVQPEEIFWVVLVLERDEPLVPLRRVGRAHALVALDAEVVYVDGLGRVRAHRLPEVTRPSDVLSVLAALGPGADHRPVEGDVAVPERGRGLRDAGDRSAEVLEVET